MSLRSILAVRSAHGLQISAALFGLMLASAMPAYSDDKNDEYRFTIDPSYALTADHKWIGVGHLGYIKSDDNNYQTDYLGAGTIWGFAPWGEIWFDVRYYQTDNESIADVEEWRLQVGFKTTSPGRNHLRSITWRVWNTGFGRSKAWTGTPKAPACVIDWG